MSLNVPAGHHFLRLAALTPANCGDTGGSAAVDRPIAVDAWSQLPYLPHSALKGVLAGRQGNVHLRGGGLNTRRTDLFGAPDENDAGTGRAGDLVFGDGEVLAFPVLLRDGRRAMVAVAAALWRLARHGILPETTRRVEDERAYDGPVSRSELPPLPEPLRTARFGIDSTALSALLGFRGPVIVAAREAARDLRQVAVEERTLTALGNDRTVRSGSLRTIELIPSGTLFISLVSNLSGKETNLGAASPIQLGAWETTGCGYFSAAVLALPPAGAPPSGEPSEGGDTTAQPQPRHEVMRTVFLAVRDLRDPKPRPEAARTRSAIFDLGPRLAQRGLAVTLAFCLAKTGGGEDAEASEDRVRTERVAYRFILRQLFAVGDSEIHARVVAAIEQGDSALPPDFHETRLWLRRYAETMLPKEKERE